MKPAMRMMMMEKIRQNDKPPRSEYGGGNERRMIGYERDGQRPSYGGERQNGDRPQGGDYPSVNGMRYEPQGAWPRYEQQGAWPRNEPQGIGPGWERPPMGNDRERPPMGRYDEPESRRRRDSRGRYAVNGPRYEDDDDEDEYSHHHRKERKGELLATGAVWMNPNKGGGYGPVTEYQAMAWVRDMEQPEGGKPMPAFRIEETEALRKAHCPECDQWEFFVTMNMKYSDLFEYARKLGVDRPEFYAYMAKAFLCDKDAAPHKLQKYMEIIPKK